MSALNAFSAINSIISHSKKKIKCYIYIDHLVNNLCPEDYFFLSCKNPHIQQNCPAMNNPAKSTRPPNTESRVDLTELSKIPGTSILHATPA